MYVYPVFHSSSYTSLRLRPIYSCAAINGINQTVVDRANELSLLSARGENFFDRYLRHANRRGNTSFGRSSENLYLEVLRKPADYSLHVRCVS